MKKILFLPLLRMQSGHHQVADALIDMLHARINGVICKKIDLISYTNESLEKVVTSSYLSWIRYAPETYNFAYKNFFYDTRANARLIKWYNFIFLKKMEQLLRHERPDLIVCTHGYPSYLLSQLKKQGKCHVPIINVYTDFFINSVWGREGIDFHFLPSQEVKEQLIRKNQVPKHRMVVTGIPVHEEITKTVRFKQCNNRPIILIAGGNSGLGGMLELSQALKDAEYFDFVVLCGKNQKLYDDILSWNNSHIQPLSYVSSRSEMNALYEQVDAIVTKPGGVTVSEAIKKRLPIIVHSFLPGQEEINLHYLTKSELAFTLEQNQPFEKQLLRLLKTNQKVNRWNLAVDTYEKGIEIGPNRMVEVITSMIGLQMDSSSVV